MTFIITIIIIAITALVSVAAFNNEKIMNDLIFYPPSVTYDKQWYRFFSCGLIHADFMHLIFNMYAFYLFGRNVETAFDVIFMQKGKLLFLFLYITALAVCLLPTYSRHREDSYYRSLGASGAVSAVIFANIMLDPIGGMGLLFIPKLYIPGFIFGFLYLAISSYLDKRGGGNINHSAHIWGALYGIVFLIVAAYIFSDYPVLEAFMQKIKEFLGRF